jgi:glycosyltransferase involved in cell wall biosynthesis
VRDQRTNPVALALVSEVRKADVVHCHQQHVLASSLAALVCKLSGRRVFVSDLGGGGWDISAYVSTDRWYHGHLHISQYSRTIYGHSDKSWAHVILGGVDAEKFSPDETLKRDGTVLFVGRLLPHKGVNDLINAVASDMPLELVGQVTDVRFIEDLKRLAKDKQVTFRHDCDDAALIRAYRKALCVVLPSVYKTMYGEMSKVPELLGQTLLEGMACGTPAICTDVASLPEVVEDGVTGFVVPAHDIAALNQRLCWLREHRQEAEEMGRAARQRVLEKFTWPSVVKRCLEIYTA